MKRTIISIAIFVFSLVILTGRTSRAAVSNEMLYRQSDQTDAIIIHRGNTGQLPIPVVTENSVEICLNSRYSQHSLGGTVNDQQLSNILWAAAQAPITGTHRDIYVLTPAGTFFYDPNSHSLARHSDEAVDEGAFAIRYERQLDFDAGVSFMPALLAAVSLSNSTEPDVASCPKGLGHPTTRLYFGIQSVRAPTTRLAARCSIPEGQPGWLPDPNTDRDNSLEEVLGRLNYTEDFEQTNLTVQQVSQLLWAGYGCSDHTASGRGGLTVPSAWANYYLTGTIYLVNETGVYRYHNRNPATALSTRDHRIEQIESSDIRQSLPSDVNDLPEAPCYFILCLDSSDLEDEFARLEVGFVASNMLMQATALDLGCHFKTELTADEINDIQAAANIPVSHVPKAIVSTGAPYIEDEL